MTIFNKIDFDLFVNKLHLLNIIKEPYCQHTITEQKTIPATSVTGSFTVFEERKCLKEATCILIQIESKRITQFSIGCKDHVPIRIHGNWKELTKNEFELLKIMLS